MQTNGVPLHLNAQAHSFNDLMTFSCHEESLKIMMPIFQNHHLTEISYKSWIVKNIKTTEIEILFSGFQILHPSLGTFFVIGEDFIVEVCFHSLLNYKELIARFYTKNGRTQQVENTFFDRIKSIVADIGGAVKADIHWYYNQPEHGVNYRNITEVFADVVHAEAYPYISDLSAFVNSYLYSPSSVLILMGTQGTGKTHLIRHIVQQFGRDKEKKQGVEIKKNWEDDEEKKTGPRILYTTDVKALESESLFIDFRCGEYDFMVLEDIDEHLVSRTSGNKIMHKFLSASDGFMSSNHKIIFSTNIHVADVDEALIRPGRCFAFLQMRTLSADEATALSVKLGCTEKFSDKATIADVYKNARKEELFVNEDVCGKRRFGFGV